MNYKTQGEVYKQDNLTIINDDCMNILKQTPDNYYDLCLVDPPYGIGWDGDNLESYNSKSCDSWKGRKPKGYDKKDWDKNAPDDEYFLELFRVSKNQIIWGGNYFKLKPTGGWIVWDKGVVMPTFSDGEMAWQSITNSMKIIKLLWAGYRKCEDTDRIHPTQKPVKLYNWIYQNYAEPGQKILDTHGGSFSSAIASYYSDKNLEFTGVELDEDYFQAGIKRIHKETRQLTFDL